MRPLPAILLFLLHLLIKLIYSLSPVYYVEESCTINLKPPGYIKKNCQRASAAVDYSFNCC